MEHEGDGDTNDSRCSWNDLQIRGKRWEEQKIGGRIEDHLEHSIDRFEYSGKSCRHDETCYCSDSGEKTSANVGEEKTR